jgi:4-hydroxybenzoate polyprenyltransferase
MQASLAKRFYQYQKERFPFLAHGVIIGAFTFSAISYSRLSSGFTDFIGWKPFLICLFNTVSFFFLLRVFDEHKDAEDDAQYRSELPVPRGLITLKELRYFAVAFAIVQVAINVIFYPIMLLPWLGVMLYMSIMGKEFFVAEWLKKHQFWYVVSHMFIIPFVDVFASGFDWYVNERPAPVGLLYFFAVSFMNGIVLEVGRKMRAPAQEKNGVLTYSSLLGVQKSSLLWAAVISVTAVLAMIACAYANYNSLAYVVLSIALTISLIVCMSYAQQPTEKMAKAMELTSGIWTIVMYLTMGGVPMLIQLISGS